MIAWLAVALADPLVIRAPVEDTVQVAIGGPDLSVGVRVRDVGLAVHTRLDGGVVGAAAGLRRALGREDGWGVDVSGSVGLAVPTVDPGLALTVTPALHVGTRGKKVTWVLGPAAPLVARLGPGPDLRLPVLVETWLGVRAGPLWVGGRLALGVVATPDADLAYTSQAQVVVTAPTP